jgi:hypothetical protein
MGLSWSLAGWVVKDLVSLTLPPQLLAVTVVLVLESSVGK